MSEEESAGVSSASVTESPSFGGKKGDRAEDDRHTLTPLSAPPLHAKTRLYGSVWSVSCPSLFPRRFVFPLSLRPNQLSLQCLTEADHLRVCPLLRSPERVDCLLTRYSSVNSFISQDSPWIVLTATDCIPGECCPSTEYMTPHLLLFRSISVCNNVTQHDTKTTCECRREQLSQKHLEAATWGNMDIVSVLLYLCRIKYYIFTVILCFISLNPGKRSCHNVTNK